MNTIRYGEMEVFGMPKGILVIDDEPTVQTFVGTLLQLHGYRVYVASSEDEAIQILAEVRPGSISLALVDLRLGPDDGNGERGLNLMRSIHTNYPDVALIAMTALGSGQVGSKVHQVGGNDFIQKPMKAHVLLERISSVLDRHESGRELERARQRVGMLVDILASALQCGILCSGCIFAGLQTTIMGGEPTPSSGASQPEASDSEATGAAGN